MPSVVPTDIVIHRPNGPFVAAIEVKNREGLTSEVATSLRRNLLAHGIVSRDVPYFLLISQDKGYLWSEGASTESDLERLPAVEFSMTDVVRRYAPKGLQGRLRESELESIVFEWLADLSHSASIGGTAEPEATLARIGFSDAIRGAVLTREVA